VKTTVVASFALPHPLMGKAKLLPRLKISVLLP
jgi:hypothetical protein